MIKVLLEIFGAWVGLAILAAGLHRLYYWLEKFMLDIPNNMW